MPKAKEPSVKIRENLVADLQKMATDKGLSLTGLVNMFLNQKIEDEKFQKMLAAREYHGPSPYRGRERYGNSSTRLS